MSDHTAGSHGTGNAHRTPKAEFYIYFALGVAIFYAFWRWYSPHPWQNWSILVTSVVLFMIYFNVQVSVAVNNWYGPFFDYVQGLMSGTGKSTSAALIGSSTVNTPADDAGTCFSPVIHSHTVTMLAASE